MSDTKGMQMDADEALQSFLDSVAQDEGELAIEDMMDMAERAEAKTEMEEKAVVESMVDMIATLIDIFMPGQTDQYRKHTLDTVRRASIWAVASNKRYVSNVVLDAIVENDHWLWLKIVRINLPVFEGFARMSSPMEWQEFQGELAYVRWAVRTVTEGSPCEHCSIALMDDPEFLKRGSLAEAFDEIINNFIALGVDPECEGMRNLKQFSSRFLRLMSDLAKLAPIWR